MQDASRFAFKEWAVVCEALRTGEQTLLIRKGGIHEGRRGFQLHEELAHPEFWLFPTKFHQSAEELIPEASSLLKTIQEQHRPENQIPFSLYATVEDTFLLDREELLPQLAGLHILTEQTIHQRFHYRDPGLMAILVRTYQQPEPIWLQDSPHFGGCKTWVDFPDALPTSELTPVLTDDEFTTRANEIRQQLQFADFG